MGYKKCGKNFNLIKKEFFTNKETSDIIDYYYNLKKKDYILLNKNKKNVSKKDETNEKKNNLIEKIFDETKCSNCHSIGINLTIYFNLLFIY